MIEVRRPPSAGQDPAHTANDPRTEIRAIIGAIHALAFDAAAPRGERNHSRHHIRRALRSRFRALEVRLDALLPVPGSEVPPDDGARA